MDVPGSSQTILCVRDCIFIRVIACTQEWPFKYWQSDPTGLLSQGFSVCVCVRTDCFGDFTYWSLVIR